MDPQQRVKLTFTCFETKEICRFQATLKDRDEIVSILFSDQTSPQCDVDDGKPNDEAVRI